MFGWVSKLFEKGPANAEKSIAGCLVANLAVTIVLGLLVWAIHTLTQSSVAP